MTGSADAGATAEAMEAKQMGLLSQVKSLHPCSSTDRESDCLQAAVSPETNKTESEAFRRIYRMKADAS